LPAMLGKQKGRPFQAAFLATSKRNDLHYTAHKQTNLLIRLDIYYLILCYRLNSSLQNGADHACIPNFVRPNSQSVAPERVQILSYCWLPE